MKIAAETHLFGSIDGYTTLAASAAIRKEDFGPLESLGFGQPTSRGAHRLVEEPVILTQPIGSRWMAITRALPGAPDTAGRETLQRLSLLLRHRDYRLVVRGDFRKLLEDRRLWKPENFQQGQRINIPIEDRGSDVEPPSEQALRVLQAWAIARRTGMPVIFPLGSEPAILELVKALHANDLPIFRWGLRLLSTGATADVATLLIDDGLATRKAIQRASINDALDIPSIRRFDGISKPLPAIFGQELPDEIENDRPDQVMEFRSRARRRSRVAAISIGAASLAALIGTAIYWPEPEESPRVRSEPVDGTVSAEPAPTTVSADLEPTSGTAPDSDRKSSQTPGDVDSPQPGTTTGSSTSGTGTGSSGGGGNPLKPEPTPVPPTNPPMTLEEAIENLMQYEGSKSPDRLEVDLDEYFPELLRALLVLKAKEPEARSDFAKLEKGIEGTNGKIPNDFRNIQRTFGRILLALDTAPSACEKIGRVRNANALIRPLLLKEDAARKQFGIANPPDGQAPTAEWARWTTDAVDRIGVWAKECREVMLLQVSDSLTNATDQILPLESQDMDPWISFAAEAHALLKDLGCPPESLPEFPAIDITTALLRLEASQKKFRENKESLDDRAISSGERLVKDTTRALRFIHPEYVLFKTACESIRAGYQAMGSDKRLESAARKVTEPLPTLVSGAAGDCMEVLERSELAINLIRNTRGKRNVELATKLAAPLKELDERIRDLRNLSQLPSSYKPRRVGNPVEDLDLMRNDLVAIKKALPGCFRGLLSELLQELHALYTRSVGSSSAGGLAQSEVWKAISDDIKKAEASVPSPKR